MFFVFFILTPIYANKPFFPTPTDSTKHHIGRQSLMRLCQRELPRRRREAQRKSISIPHYGTPANHFQAALGREVSLERGLLDTLDREAFPL